MLALFGLIPLKDWLYAGIIAALLGGFAYYTHHERSVGEAREVAAVAKVSAVAEAKVTAANTVAQTMETQDAKTFDETVAAPAVRDLGIVCHRTGSDHVPQAAPLAAPGVGEQPTNGAVGSTFDPSGPLLERARVADAQIVYLQGRVHELESQMETSP